MLDDDVIVVVGAGVDMGVEEISTENALSAI